MIQTGRAHSAAAVLLTLVLAGCAVDGPRSVNRYAAYDCENDVKLAVTFDDARGLAMVTPRGAPLPEVADEEASGESSDAEAGSEAEEGPLLIELPAQPSEGGFLYETAEYSFAGNGRDATLTVTGHSPLRCLRRTR